MGENIKLILEIVQVLALVPGGIFALIQWSKGNALARAELEKRLVEKINDDDIIAKTFILIDWEKIKYKKKFYLKQGKESRYIDADTLELMIDKTLAHYSFICYLRNRKIFREADMKPFEYELGSLFQNKEICNYLFSLYHYSESRMRAKSSYHYLILYGLEKGYLNERFKIDIDSNGYTNYLREER